ncbi:unnamed protein product [Diamesa serratosioi]
MKCLVILLLGCLVCLIDCRTKEWWERGNFYQIYPRSFKDSDGDGVGDLIGITQKMPYLKDIGMTGVWLSPIFKSPMADFGYDISNYTDIHYEYGTLEDFDNLVKECKRLNVKLILDFVPNHTSDEHLWFKKSELSDPYYKDFYVWHPGKTNAETGKVEPPSNWNSLFRYSAWQWSDIRQEYYLHQCIIKQPDLNYRNPDVVKEMKNVLTFWLKKGIAGFRIDAAPYLFEAVNDDGSYPDEPLSGLCDDVEGTCYLNHIYTKDQPGTYDMVYQWRELVDQFSKDNGGDARILMTESYTTLEQNFLFYGDAFGRRGSQIPFNFQIIDNIKLNSTPSDYKNAIESWLLNMPHEVDYVPNWVVGNHDQHRVVNRLGLNRTDLLNIMVQTLPGIAVTYNGEEIGMTDQFISWENTIDPLACNQDPDTYEALSRDPARTPFQWDDSRNAGFSNANVTWLPVGSNYASLNVKKETPLSSSHLNVFKKLVKLRQIRKVLQDGSFEALVDNNLLIYKREIPGSQLFVVLNLGTADQDFLLSEYFPTIKSLVIASVTSDNSRIVMGVFWIISIIASSLACFYMIFELILKIQRNPIIDFLADELTPISEISFPAISYCPEVKTVIGDFDYGKIVDAIKDNEIQISDLSDEKIADVFKFERTLEIYEYNSGVEAVSCNDSYPLKTPNFQLGFHGVFGRKLAAENYTTHFGDIIDGQHFIVHKNDEIPMKSSNRFYSAINETTVFIIDPHLKTIDEDLYSTSLEEPEKIYAVEFNVEKHPSEVTFLFKENEVFTFIRKRQFTTVDFLSDCGGILGLFAGISVLSIVEVVYYFSLRILVNAWIDRKKSKIIPVKPINPINTLDDQLQTNNNNTE